MKRVKFKLMDISNTLLIVCGIFFISISIFLFCFTGSVFTFLIASFIGCSAFFTAYTIKLNAIKTIKKQRDTHAGVNFLSDTDLEAINWRLGKYIGIDLNNKSIILLDLTIYPNKIKTFSFDTLTGYYCKGSIIRYNFRDISLPTFIMNYQNEHNAYQACCKLDLIISNNYSLKSSLAIA
ncbi:hypothetical protein [Escherichia coli]|uniref:hypothetical protein n=1 Tax=Escherichia coli TaxID=562 RepID=UPI0038B2D1E6